MSGTTYPLADNPALIQLVKGRRVDGQPWEELVTGDVQPAIKQLSPEDVRKLKELTTPPN